MPLPGVACAAVALAKRRGYGVDCAAMRRKNSTPPPRSGHRDKTAEQRREVKYYGLAACLAIWRSRPADIIRIYLEQSRLGDCADMLRWAAQQRKAYHVVAAEDLERLTESVHHQGICLLAVERPPLPVRKFQQQLAQHNGALLLVYLDGVENPHNLGAILRSCAHFGLPYLLGDANQLPRLSASTCRVAEGGAEHVHMVADRSAPALLRELAQAGFHLIGTSVAAAGGGSGETAAAAKTCELFSYTFPARSVLIMGAEVSGISPGSRRLAQSLLRIPGSGAVESLNVSVAFAVIAAEFYRQHHVVSR